MSTSEAKTPAALFKEREEQLNSILLDVQKLKEKKSLLLAQFLFVGIFGVHVNDIPDDDVDTWVDKYFKNEITIKDLRLCCILKLQQGYLEKISK